jgi:hypothetical protein
VNAFDVLERVPQDRILKGYLSGGRALVEISYFPTQRGRWMDSLAYRIQDSGARELARIAVEVSPPRDLYVGIPGNRAAGVPGVAFMSRQPFTHHLLTAQDPMGNRAVAVVPYVYWNRPPGRVKLVLMDSAGVDGQRRC